MHIVHVANSPGAIATIKQFANEIPQVTNTVLQLRGLAATEWFPEGVCDKMDFWTEAVAAKFQPDGIIAYDVPEETWIDEPECPILELGTNSEYAVTLVSLDGIKLRDQYLDPKECQVFTEAGCLYTIGRAYKDYDVVLYKQNRVGQRITDIIQAMASGTVFVVPRLPVFKDLIHHGITGLYYTAEDEADLLVHQLRNDPIAREEIGTQASKWVRETADIKVLAAFVNCLR